eukprot:CAMPEP_0117607892 /NCGR_PEP_ID=MMETSP0784-20121206/80519_1 /TAXON_ID=39447 /ORGANISM="" /LENGTH=78 /DNA_ID=CAMNT_0005411133 /DNA_START=42 /DNA_END=278 /DNA_ORIENTATION=-
MSITCSQYVRFTASSTAQRNALRDAPAGCKDSKADSTDPRAQTRVLCARTPPARRLCTPTLQPSSSPPSRATSMPTSS